MAIKFEKVSDGNYSLDIRGYVCPQPQLYTKKSLEKMNEGEIVKVVFDNPSSAETIAQMCDQAGHDILERKQEGGEIVMVIKKG